MLGKVEIWELTCDSCNKRIELKRVLFSSDPQWSAPQPSSEIWPKGWLIEDRKVTCSKCNNANQ